jgi:hypothetical protein
MEIPAEAFQEIIAELEKRPLQINEYRVKTGLGRSQTFGLVSRRSAAVDFSRMCWKRSYLYSLLLDFASKYVNIPFTSITVNQNYKAGPHFDKHNVGTSLLVAFGDYTGGDLRVHTAGDFQGIHDVKYKSLVMDFTTNLHSVEDFEGNRYSLVFYQIQKIPSGIPTGSVKKEGNKYFFYRGDEKITDGLPHVLKGRKKEPKGVQIGGPVVVSFS